MVASGKLLVGGIPGVTRPQDRDALSSLSGLTEDHPDQAVTWALLALAQLRTEAEAGAVSRSAGLSSRLCPAWALPANLEGNAWFREQNLEAAKKAYTTSLSLGPTYAAPMFNLALLALRRGDHHAAESKLDQLLAQDPFHESARLVRGQARLMAGRPSEAVKDLREAVAQAPGSASAQLLLGNALAEVGSSEESERALCRAKALGHPLGESVCPGDTR